MPKEDGYKNLKPYTKENHSWPRQEKFIVKVDRIRSGEVMKALLNFPASKIISMNKDLKEYVLEKFGQENIDMLTTEMLLDFQLICEGIFNPSAAVHKQIKENAYGKRREEDPDVETIKLPEMANTAEVFANMPYEELLRLAEMKKPQEALTMTVEPLALEDV